MHLPHQIAAVFACLGAQAAGDDHLAVLGQRLADGVEAFPHRIVDEAAGVDDHQVGAGVGLRRGVALGAELGQDQFGVGQRLGTPKRDEADAWRGRRSGSVGDGRTLGKQVDVHRGIFPDRRGCRRGKA